MAESEPCRWRRAIRVDAAADETAVLVVVVAAVGEQRRRSAGRPTGRGRAARGRAVRVADSLRLPPVSVQAAGGHRRLRSGGACYPDGRDQRGWDPSNCFRSQVTGSGDRPVQLELVGGVQLGQHQLVQPVPDAGLLPRSQAPPRRWCPHPKPSCGGRCSQPIPVCSTNKIPLQHAPVIKRLAIYNPGSAAASPAATARSAPQPVRNLPRSRPHRHPPELDDGCRRTSRPPNRFLSFS